jgi:multidrug efflux pump subunit AcrA (membrane-fusion protein)
MRAEVHLANPSGTLMHGMYARVLLTTDLHENALTVPASAVAVEGSDTVVYAVKDGQIARVVVKRGLADETKIELTEGVGEDAQIVSNPKSVKPGMAAKAVVKN